MMTIEPPKNDEVIDRHQYYATMAAMANENARDINGIGKKVSVLNDSHELVRETVHTAVTTVKTVISGAILIWTLIGGALGWYIQRTLANYENFTKRIEQLEKKQTIIESENEQRKELPEQVASMRRILNDHQRQIDELESRKK